MANYLKAHPRQMKEGQRTLHCMRVASARCE